MYIDRPRLQVPPANIVNWRRTSTPGDPLPIPLDAVKSFVKRPIEDTFWDQEYEGFIRVATAEIERVARIDLTAKTWTGSLYQFWDRIALIRRPFVALETLKYVAAATGEILDVPAATYHTLPVEQLTAMVFLGEDLDWPDAARRMDAVQVTVRSGFAVSDADRDAGHPDMPDEIRHALLMTISAMDAKRGDDAGSGGRATTVYAMKTARGGSLLPPEARSLISDYVYRWVTV